MASMTFLLIVLLALREAQLAYCNIVNNSNKCVCPGDMLIFECHIENIHTSASLTVWSSSAITCPDLGYSSEILLSHSEFSLENGTSKECNNGMVVARSIGIVNNSYISQLTVTVGEEMNNITIECNYDNGTSVTLIETDTIILTGIGVNMIAPPTGITLTVFNFSVFYISWDPVSGTVCPSPSYAIDANNCGICQNKTKESFILCKNVAIDGQECKFSIRTEICSNYTSDSISFSLIKKAPLPPTMLYLKVLQSGTISVMFSESNNTTKFIASSTVYTIVYFDSVSNISCDSVTIPSSACISGICFYNLQISSDSTCSRSTSVKFAVYATNALGRGTESDPVNVILGTKISEESEPNATYSYVAISGIAFVVIVIISVILLIIIIKFHRKVCFHSIKRQNPPSQIEHNISQSNDSENANGEDISYYVIQSLTQSEKPSSRQSENIIYTDIALNVNSLGQRTQLREFSDNIVYADIRHQANSDALKSESNQNSFQEIDKSLNLDSLLIQIRSQVTPKWYQFGVAVGISQKTLNKLSLLPPEECIIEMLDIWLRGIERNTLVTWRDVAKAVNEIGLHILAEDLLKVYETGKLPVVVDMDSVPSDIIRTGKEQNKYPSPPPIPLKRL